MAIKKNRSALVEERNNKIEEMDITELKKYLCMKNNQNPEKCEGCPGIDTCKAGHRAVELLKTRKAESAETMQRTWHRTERGQRWIAESKARTEAYIRKVISADDPRKFLMETEGLDSRQARKKLENWRRRHQELLAGVTWSLEKKGRKLKEEKPVAETVVNIPVNIETDEIISLEDFLSSMEDTGVTQNVAKPAEKIKEEPARTDFGSQLKAKADELEKERKRIDAEIDRLRDRSVWINKALDALAMTMNLFNPESAIGKDLRGE